jgi:hypothetical protein
MQLPFDTPIQDTGSELIGPLRVPRQMLAAQKYDDHTSIHDNATAQKFGFKGGTIEGPTHFSQFAPLCVALWGPRWLEQGSLSAHYRNACFEGEKVRALLAKPADEATQTTIRMEREDGTEILRGTAAVGANNPPSALEQRISELSPPQTPVILRDVQVGMRTKRITVRMAADQNMGALYPFSLAHKLQAITEPSTPRRFPFASLSWDCSRIRRSACTPARCSSASPTRWIAKWWRSAAAAAPRACGSARACSGPAQTKSSQRCCSTLRT